MGIMYSQYETLFPIILKYECSKNKIHFHTLKNTTTRYRVVVFIAKY